MSRASSPGGCQAFRGFGKSFSGTLLNGVERVGLVLRDALPGVGQQALRDLFHLFRAGIRPFADSGVHFRNQIAHAVDVLFGFFLKALGGRLRGLCGFGGGLDGCRGTGRSRGAASGGFGAVCGRGRISGYFFGQDGTGSPLLVGRQVENVEKIAVAVGHDRMGAYGTQHGQTVGAAADARPRRGEGNMHVILAALVAQRIGKDPQHGQTGGVRDLRRFAGDDQPLIFFRRAQPHPDDGPGYGAAALIRDARRDVDKRKTAHSTS